MSIVGAVKNASADGGPEGPTLSRFVGGGKCCGGGATGPASPSACAPAPRKAQSLRNGHASQAAHFQRHPRQAWPTRTHTASTTRPVLRKQVPMWACNETFFADACEQAHRRSTGTVRMAGVGERRIPTSRSGCRHLALPTKRGPTPQQLSDLKSTPLTCRRASRPTRQHSARLLTGARARGKAHTHIV